MTKWVLASALATMISFGANGAERQRETVTLDKRSCRRCNGKGVRDVACPACRGSGRANGGRSTRRCAGCAGTGFVGRGWYCTECSGRGYHLYLGSLRCSRETIAQVKLREAQVAYQDALRAQARAKASLASAEARVAKTQQALHSLGHDVNGKKTPASDRPTSRRPDNVNRPGPPADYTKLPSVGNPE